MNIAIDIRSLQDTKPTGVAQYTKNLLTELLKLDTKNHYFLFCNSFFNTKYNFEFLNLSQQNITLCNFKIPNKILNALILLKLIKLDELINKKYKIKIDKFFFPNPSFINVSQNCDIFLTIHDTSFYINPSWFSFKMQLWHKLINTKKLTQQAKHIFTVSQNTNNSIQNIFKTPIQKITTTQLGLNTLYSWQIKTTQITQSILETTRKKYNLPKKFILSLATIEPRKNINTIIDAFENLNAEYELILIGNKGWKHNPIFKQIKKSNKKNNIKFLNYILEADKPIIFALADLFIFPSYYEGFGLPPIEASSMGCPVICSTGSSMGEVMKDGCLYVNPYLSNQLTTAITLLLNNNALKTKLIKKGFEIASSYSWHQTAQKTLEVLNEGKKNHTTYL